MTAYGNEKANDGNVSFSFDLALQAARDLYALAGEVRSHESERARAANLARPDWQGRAHEQFEQKMADEGTEASIVADGLIALATTFAGQWAKARGQQDRINFARYVQHAMDDDCGGPPEDPPLPLPPAYEPTRSPVHPEHENQR